MKRRCVKRIGYTLIPFAAGTVLFAGGLLISMPSIDSSVHGAPIPFLFTRGSSFVGNGRTWQVIDKAALAFNVGFFILFSSMICAIIAVRAHRLLKYLGISFVAAMMSLAWYRPFVDLGWPHSSPRLVRGFPLPALSDYNVTGDWLTIDAYDCHAIGFFANVAVFWGALIIAAWLLDEGKGDTWRRARRAGTD